MVVESLMMAIAAVVPHYLMGIAAGAGIMGMYMLVCGFFQPVGALPGPVWRYPLHYIAYHSYTFAGFMRNEFLGTDGWECACVESGTCPGCTMTGEEIVEYWLKGGNGLNKWADVGIQVAMIAIYRVIFWAMLVAKEKMRT
uniref:ABC-2 type transporter transmembrane domain-containing protein n=1 Tax=Chlamydomonas leiostraca TaxID=1034604 RepID=A0A7S0RIE9_9CHLO|mmetsp:Transcript_2389/g.6028  ORF Transcript_2389/g.6028 Transcript_2389/m.6028 type:complete len:141 (+) Transcript_2389:408-830(+)